MSAHPHPGRRSEWLSTHIKPSVVFGRFEGRYLDEKRRIFVCYFICGQWYKLFNGVLHHCAMNFPRTGQWRGLAEEPK